jgi:hypothetical protein
VFEAIPGKVRGDMVLKTKNTKGLRHDLNDKVLF